MPPEMDAQHPPVPVGQDIEIAACLRRLDDAEGVFLVRHLDIDAVVAGYLQEYAGIGPALVSLSGRMKESRSEAQAGADALAITDQHADILERVAMTSIALDVGEERAIVAFL